MDENRTTKLIKNCELRIAQNTDRKEIETGGVCRARMKAEDGGDRG